MAEVEWETESEDEAQEQAPPIVVKTEPTIKTEPETKSVSTSAPIVEKKKVDAEAVRKVRRDMLDYYKRTDEAERLALQLVSDEHNMTSFISNMSCLFHTGSPIDLRTLARRAPNAELDLGRRPNVTIRRRASEYV